MVEPVSITEVVSDCFLAPSEIPPEKLAKRLETAKKYFLTAVERDCRQTTVFLEEWRGKKLYKHFCEDWQEFCLQYFERPAEWLDYVAEGARLLDSGKPVPATQAVTAVELKNSTVPDRKRQPSPETLEKAARARELREQGLTQKQIGEEIGTQQAQVSKLLSIPDTCNNITSVRNNGSNTSRPKTRGTSNEYRQALLERDAPELAEEVKAGKLTTNQAMVKAGKVKSRTFTLGPRTDLDALAQKLLTHNRQLAMALAEAIIDQAKEES